MLRNRNYFVHRELRAARRPISMFQRRRTHPAHRFGRVPDSFWLPRRRRRQLHKAKLRLVALPHARIIRTRRRRRRPSFRYYQTVTSHSKCVRARRYVRLQLIRRAKRRRRTKGRITLYTPRVLWWSPSPRPRKRIRLALSQTQKTRVLAAVRASSALQPKEMFAASSTYVARRRDVLRQSFTAHRVLRQRTRGPLMSVPSRGTAVSAEGSRYDSGSYTALLRKLTLAHQLGAPTASSARTGAIIGAAHGYLRRRVSTPFVLIASPVIARRARWSRQLVYGARTPVHLKAFNGFTTAKGFAQYRRTKKVSWRHFTRSLKKYSRQEPYRKRQYIRERKDLRYRLRRQKYHRRMKKGRNKRTRAKRCRFHRTGRSVGTVTCALRRRRRGQILWRRRYREGRIFAQRRSRYLARKRSGCALRRRRYFSQRLTVFNQRMRQLARACPLPTYPPAPSRLPYMNFNILVLRRQRCRRVAAIRGRLLGRAGRTIAFHRARNTPVR